MEVGWGHLPELVRTGDVGARGESDGVGGGSVATYCFERERKGVAGRGGVSGRLQRVGRMRDKGPTPSTLIAPPAPAAPASAGRSHSCVRLPAPPLRFPPHHPHSPLLQRQQLP
eukprot:158566-Chlamydomonas_euryale.AAC.1